MQWLRIIPPVVLIIASAVTFWLDSSHRVEVSWAEGLGLTLLIIGGVWLPVAYRSLGRSPVKVGVDVRFVIDLHTHVGTVTRMRGDMCTVRTPLETFEINRYDLTPASRVG